MYKYLNYATTTVNIVLSIIFWRFFFSYYYIANMISFLLSYLIISFFVACFVWCFDFATQRGQVLEFVANWRILLAQYKNGKYAFTSKWIGGCATCTCVFFGTFAALFTVLLTLHTAHPIFAVYASFIPFAVPIFFNFIKHKQNG